VYLGFFLPFHTGLFTILKVMRGVLVFLCWIFIFYFLILKSCWCMLSMYQYVNDIRTFWMARASPPCGQTWPLALSLKVPPCSLLHDVTCNREWLSVCHRWSFFFFPFLFFLIQKKCTFVLFSFYFSISIIIIFIIYFHHWPS